MVSSPSAWSGEETPTLRGFIHRKICLLSSLSQAEHVLAKQLGEGLHQAAPRAAAAVAVPCRTAAPQEPPTLTSSLWLSPRCSRSGSSHKECPRGRSTRERWPRRWGTSCSPAPRRPPGWRPAGGDSRCASPPPRSTARPGLRPGSPPGLDTGKSHQRRRKPR